MYVDVMPDQTLPHKAHLEMVKVDMLVSCMNVAL